VLELREQLQSTLNATIKLFISFFQMNTGWYICDLQLYVIKHSKESYMKFHVVFFFLSKWDSYFKTFKVEKWFGLDIGNTL
jgi:hypothetical protein